MEKVARGAGGRSFIKTGALAALLVAAAASQAGAQASRAWVSGVGDDANPCSRTAPCKTFAGAISKTLAGGVIDVLDPGGFGAVTITKSITIETDGAIGGILASGTNGIIVDAGPSDVVILRNLSFDGFGTGLRGVNFIAGGALHVERCSFEGFTQAAIGFEPSGAASLFVHDTVIHGNRAGIQVRGGASAVEASIERTSVDGDTGNGIRVLDNAKALLRDVTVSGVGKVGLQVWSSLGEATANVERSTFAHSGGAGIAVGGGSNPSVVRLGDSTVVGNLIGLDIKAMGSVLSFGDNRIADNVSTEAPTAVLPLQ